MCVNVCECECMNVCARALCSDLMRDAYVELHAANRDLLSAYAIRSTNHEELVAALKTLNQTIQQQTRLKSMYSSLCFCRAQAACDCLVLLCRCGRGADRLCGSVSGSHQGRQHATTLRAASDQRGVTG